MNSKDIRDHFFRYFESMGHIIVPSASIVIKDDPTLLFTNAGMNQFKDYFLGNSVPEHTKIANTQKCLRVSGKHNDLDEVGVDSYHHTMFEMLGNWSFGDYFKQDAIKWAWDLLTREYEIDPNRLYVTVFGGDTYEGLATDIESIDNWKKWIDESHILKFGKKDNFWEMGATGPCGPCSEIHIDLRNDKKRNNIDGTTLVNKGHPEVIEIWNLVFMEYNRLADHSLEPLPQKHVDTGMGLERLARIIQNKSSNYETDVFSALLRKMEEITGLQYKEASESRSKKNAIINIGMRVVVDHIRAISIAISDGQLPSNTGAGYVIRRILRRAIRYGYQSLNLSKPFLYLLVPIVTDFFKDVFPEMQTQEKLIEKIIKEEEKLFFQTLFQGLKRIDELCIKLNAEKSKIIPDEDSFELYDTFGFPFDLTALIADEYGLQVSKEGFEKKLEKQRIRSRKATIIQVGDWVEVLEDDVEEFVGYDFDSAFVYITQYREVTSKGKNLFQIVLNITPFYPESGGQIGDTGYLESKTIKIPVINTVKENGLIVHYTEILPKNIHERFNAVVNTKERNASAANHSATHLLHQALRQVLGAHIEQKGSLVAPDHLRFDFSHFQKVTSEELANVEILVNHHIRQNHKLEEERALPIKRAKEMGALALFGEKYGDVVRVIKFGDSIELCGGIHVPFTSNIGNFIITMETAVASGIRRIEAITSTEADAFVQDKLTLVKDISSLLNHPKNLVSSIKELINKNHKMQKILDKQIIEAAGSQKEDLLKNMKEINGIHVIISKVEMSADLIKSTSFELLKQVNNLFLVLAAINSGKVNLAVGISENLVNDKGMHAGKIIGDLAKEIKGGGGGQPFFAMAGGKDVSGINRSLEKALAIVS